LTVKERQCASNIFSYKDRACARGNGWRNGRASSEVLRVRK
jgi:hypothetical protein